MGRSKAPENLIKVWWRCGKQGNYKKYCKVKNSKTRKGFECGPSIEKTSSNEEGDVYLTTSCT